MRHCERLWEGSESVTANHHCTGLMLCFSLFILFITSDMLQIENMNHREILSFAFFRALLSGGWEQHYIIKHLYRMILKRLLFTIYSCHGNLFFARLRWTFTWNNSDILPVMTIRGRSHVSLNWRFYSTFQQCKSFSCLIIFWGVWHIFWIFFFGKLELVL